MHAVALPKGPLPASGCTAGTGTSACDLWATAGSLTLPGQTAAVPVWNFTSNQGDTPTGTGPILVVNQGDAVTITLHNTIALAGNVSLAVPGMTGLVDDTTGVAAGGSKTYTFTASRPGTYLYEAGHTADGARQAAMGLVGALIVRPADFGTATTDLGAAGSPASAFTDEAVLVLSDLDPAFNTAVGTGASLRPAQLQRVVPDDQRQGLPQHRPNRVDPRKHGAAALRQRRRRGPLHGHHGSPAAGPGHRRAPQ